MPPVQAARIGTIPDNKMQKRIEKYRESLTLNKALKVPLRKVLKGNGHLVKIERVVSTMNKLVIHTTQFVRAYLLNLYDVKQPFPTMDRTFFLTAMKLFVKQGGSGRTPGAETLAFRNTLQTFYDTHYADINLFDGQNIEATHMSKIMDYQADKLVTNMETNIKVNMSKYVNRYVNVCHNKQSRIEEIKASERNSAEQKSAISELCSELRRIKNKIFDLEDEDVDAFVEATRRLLGAGDRTIEKNNFHYDVQCSPQPYLRPMLHMARIIQEKDAKTFQFFPVRSSIIPAHCRIDTATLIYCLEEKDHMKLTRKGQLVKVRSAIWTKYFRVNERKYQLKGYRFNNQIETDGVSCTLLYLRQDRYKKDKSNRQLGRVKKPKGYTDEVYIDNEVAIAKCQGKKLVGGDPGKNDLVYCTDGERTFRYSSQQRRVESRSTKYRRIREEKARKTMIVDPQNQKIGSAQYLEKRLSNKCSKDCTLAGYLSYLKTKNELCVLLRGYYGETLFRKLRLNAYVNTRRSEDQMVERFKQAYGGPDEAVLCIGDWSQRQQMKFREPTIGKQLRTIFRRHGYFVPLVDEWGTSSRCCVCHAKAETYLIVNDPRPWKEGQTRRLHTLLRCTSAQCKSVRQRDNAGSTNIQGISSDAVLGLSRKPAFCRPVRCSTNQRSSVDSATTAAEQTTVTQTTAESMNPHNDTAPSGNMLQQHPS